MPQSNKAEEENWDGGESLCSLPNMLPVTDRCSRRIAIIITTTVAPRAAAVVAPEVDLAAVEIPHTATTPMGTAEAPVIAMVPGVPMAIPPTASPPTAIPRVPTPPVDQVRANLPLQLPMKRPPAVLI